MNCVIFRFLATVFTTVLSFAGARAESTLPVPNSHWVEIARGVWIVPEVPTTNREPDGNSVIFAASSGLVVFDTGRHTWHHAAILALAGAQKQPIIAIINSHWHLDHVSGNPSLRTKFPGLRVYASNAIDGALSGFLADSVTGSSQYINDPRISPEMREDLLADNESIRHGELLRPDAVIRAASALTIGAHRFQVKLAHEAATAGDVWLYDPASGIVALGDLVTLPAPYLDTACPEGWQSALQSVTRTRFKMAIPGHGPVLDYSQVLKYRRGFESFVACAKSAASREVCSAQWAVSVAGLLPNGGYDANRARGIAAYYVDLLRANGQNRRYCQAYRPA